MKYIFLQEGGDATGSQFFNQYVDNLIQQQDYLAEEDFKQPEENDFIDNLYSYDEEQIKEYEIEDRFQSINKKIDEIHNTLLSNEKELDYFNSDEGIDYLTKMYDTNNTEVMPFSNQYSSSDNSFSGIFKVEGASLGQPTNLKSSALGRGQMIRGTRYAMYKKLGIPQENYKQAEQKFRTDSDFEMQVLNAYREELDNRIPSNITGQQREYMLAKGWYTGDPFYPDNKVPGKSAGNRLTAGQYARKTLGLK